MARTVGIVSTYRDYTPPFDVEATVRTLLRYVPEERLAGLRHIELTTSRLSRKERRQRLPARGRKHRMEHCLGAYRDGEVRLLVDNIFTTVPAWFARWPLTRHLVIGDVLFHEIGHHIHRTQRPATREPEMVAEAWKVQLLRGFFFRRYWYLRPLVGPAFAVARHLYRRQLKAARPGA
jgi:hypothetical protein